MLSAHQQLSSRPLRLHWAGWTTTTWELQRAGWELSAEQDMMRDSMAVAFHHRQGGYHGVSQQLPRWSDVFHRAAGLDVSPVDIAAHVHIGRDVYLSWSDRPSFGPIDAEPRLFGNEQVSSLRDLAHFAPMQSLAAPFVLPEQDVDQLLALILEKQQKAKTDYFRDLVRKEGAILPAHTMSAQIITLREAA